MSDAQVPRPNDPDYRDPTGSEQPPLSSSGPPSAASPLSEADDRQWASLAHLGGILGFLPSLIILLVFKDRGRLVNTEAKEALNFQITLLIGYVAINVVSSILAIITFGIGGIFVSLVGLLWIAGVIFSIMGFLKAKDGQNYRYPFALRLVK